MWGLVCVRNCVRHVFKSLSEYLSQILSEYLSRILSGILSEILSQILSELLFQILSPKTFAAAVRCCSYNKNFGKPVQIFGHDLGHDLGKAQQNFEQHFGHDVGKTRFLIVELTMSEMLSEFLPTFAQFLSQILPTFVRILSQICPNRETKESKSAKFNPKNCEFLFPNLEIRLNS